jgi:hypothetical protein
MTASNGSPVHRARGLSLGVMAYSHKENERRLPIHPLHLARSLRYRDELVAEDTAQLTASPRISRPGV